MMEDLEKKRAELLEQANGIIVPYSEEYSASHADFALKMWPNKKRRRDEAYIRWKFRGPSNGLVNGFLLAVLDGQVVGQFGLIPVKVKIDDQIIPAQWACDLMVDSSIRKKRLGSMLLAVGMNRDMVTLGSDPSNLADIAMARVGFFPLRGPDKMIFPLDISYTLNWKMGGRWKNFIPFLSALGQPFWNWYVKSHYHQRNDQVYVSNRQSVTPLVELEQKSITKPHIVHDDEFLSWRYSVMNTPLVTLTTKAGGYAICEATPYQFYVYDWHGVDIADATDLFGQILKLASESKSKIIMVYANDLKERSMLKKFGYLKMRTPTKVIAFPRKAIPESITEFHYCIYDSDGNL